MLLKVKPFGSQKNYTIRKKYWKWKIIIILFIYHYYPPEKRFQNILVSLFVLGKKNRSRGPSITLRICSLRPIGP